MTDGTVASTDNLNFKDAADRHKASDNLLKKGSQSYSKTDAMRNCRIVYEVSTPLSRLEED
jgi:hypothetical protein